MSCANQVGCAVRELRRRGKPLASDGRRTKFESPAARDARLERGRFYASAKWRKLRAKFLQDNPICSECNFALAVAVDHIVPRLDDKSRALDVTNLRALCTSCHARIGQKFSGRLNKRQ